MDDAGAAGRRRRLSRDVAWILIGVLVFLAGSAAAAPRTTFVHSVGFSFDYPSKWQVKRLQEGLLLIPNGVDRDAAGRPFEVMVIGFVDVGATDPLDPEFSDAFERHYRSLVPNLTRIGDMDWVKTSVGTGMVIPFEDRHRNPHRIYCAVHGELGILLAYVTRSAEVRPRNDRVREIFSSFRWTEGAIDPHLVRSWTVVAAESVAEETVRWVFADDGRIKRAAGQGLRGERASRKVRGGFYSSSDGVLDIVWDHGLEESYRYNLSKRPGGGSLLELRLPDGEALRLH